VVQVEPEVELVEDDEEADDETVDEDEQKPAIDDLGTSLVEIEKPKQKEKKKVVVVQPAPAKEEEVDDDDAEKRRNKGKELVFDEGSGRVVTKRKRKGSRRRHEWEAFEDMDVDDVLDEF
jgi:hypothetical protein